MKPKYVPYTQTAQSWMVAGGLARFSKTCVLYQLVKFAGYNVRIIKIVLKGHAA
jgi:hypothetical protein